MGLRALQFRVGRIIPPRLFGVLSVNESLPRRSPTIPNPRYVNPIVVTAIEPFDHGHKKRVILTDTRDGTQHEILFGDSVSDRLIHIKAPFLVTKTKQKRG